MMQVPDERMPRVMIRPLRMSDAQALTDAERAQGWHTDIEKFRARLSDCENGLCVSLCAEVGGQPAGYLHVYKSAARGAHGGRGIPEIVDFAVLEAYRNHGVGTKLMDEAERIAALSSDIVCLGVGLHSGYGSAQRMYAKRGYVPDGSGVWYGDAVCPPYTACVNDDELVLYLSKTLR